MLEPDLLQGNPFQTEMFTSVISHNSKALDKFSAVSLDIFLGFLPIPQQSQSGCGSSLESSAALPSAWGHQNPAAACPFLFDLSWSEPVQEFGDSWGGYCENLAVIPV